MIVRERRLARCCSGPGACGGQAFGSYTSLVPIHPRHAARTQEWPALPAGRVPLSAGMAPAAERRAVRRRKDG